MKKIITTKNAPAPIGPYSQAVQYGDTLYVSGQIPVNPATGKMNNETLKEETLQVMHNLEGILKEAGMDFSNVVKCSIFLKNMDDFAEINSIYGEFFKVDPPARETVQVAKLPLDVNVEISCIAVV